MCYIMEKFKRTWNETQDIPLADSMDFSMSSSCTIKSIAFHHLRTKTGSNFVFSWGTTNIQQDFHHSENDQEMLESMTDDVDKAISDYKVTSAERSKHINNEIQILKHCDSDSHTPLLVYVHSLAADQERNLHRKEKQTAWKSWDQSYKQGWKRSGYPGWEDYGGGNGSQSGSYRWYPQKRSDMMVAMRSYQKPR